MTFAASSLLSFRQFLQFVNANLRVGSVLVIAALTACGGGGGGGGNVTGTPIGGGGGGSGSGNGWQAGVFLDASTFASQCTAPRMGTNPATGQAFADTQGTTTDENNFLRSYSDDTYLWYDEITDQDPGLFSDPLDYFDELRTTATTASGAAKDKFHFVIDSEAWFQLSQSGVSAGYGATIVLLSATPPRDAIVAYTEPNTPATAPGVALERGARVLAIDEVDINDNTTAGIDILNAGLFPAGAGEMHTFEIQDPGSANSRMVSMTSANITSEPVQNVTVIDTGTGRVGYMLFNDHIATAEQSLINAVNTLNANQGIDDLVLDIRYNGGGFLDIASEFSYMLAGPGATAGQVFEEIQFNDKHPSTNPVTGQPLMPTPFHTTTQGFSVSAGQTLPTLNLSRVFVLTGSGTCSASESIMNSLRGVNVEVVQIGSTTCGKPYGFFPADNCGTTYFTIQFRGVNAMNFGDYTDGFSPANAVTNIGTLIPGCVVADDFDSALGDATEARLAAALNYRDTESCPAAALLSQSERNKAAARLPERDGVVIKSPWLTNRIMRR